jgi:hypothetical protein
MVHVRYCDPHNVELWLGEAKFYQNSAAAIAEAIKSIETHIDQGFLNREKLILGPQISNNIPHYHEIRNLFSVQTSLDKLFESAVFPVCIACDSASAATATAIDDSYRASIRQELNALKASISKSGLTSQIKIVLIYVPLGCKKTLAASFDKMLKGLTS